MVLSNKVQTMSPEKKKKKSSDGAVNTNWVSPINIVVQLTLIAIFASILSLETMFREMLISRASSFW